MIEEKIKKAIDSDVDSDSKNVRLSLSISKELVNELDVMVDSRGFKSRSQCVSELIASQIVEYKAELGEEVMAGTITLVYNRRKTNCQQKIADIKFKYAIEVVSSLIINLENNHMMEVIIIQGPTAKLKELSNELTAVKGVKTGKFSLTATILPPLHNREK